MALRAPLDQESREKLAQLTRVMSEREARLVVGDLSPEAFARSLAGLPVTRGTCEQIRAGLARHGGQAA
ncbi:MAG TPA: hypothetical protein VJN18_14395 [Polyangiaceae bacterium]|nr:hypothetical protein [Polyangiaceae bacterium]